MGIATRSTGLHAWSASTGISARRQLLTAIAAIAAIAVLTLVLGHDRDNVGLTIVFLLFLAVVVVASAIGGSIVGTAIAVIAFLVANFYFTDPRHTLNVSDPERLAELIIFLVVAGTVAALGDVANRRREVIDLQEIEAAELAAANELRTALLRAVSHDLRTPLTTAKLATSSLRAADVEFDPHERAELLELADGQIDRLIAIVENLLDAGRLQAGVLTVDIEAAELPDIAGSVLAALPDEHRRLVQLDIDDDLPAVSTDGALLERVLANLVANAVHAAPTTTTELSARRDGDDVIVAVVDHGPGLSDDQLTAAIRPFHRFEDRGGGGGVGLGLPICIGFCEAMGADLELTPTPGGGLTASVRLTAASTTRTATQGTTHAVRHETRQGTSP